MANRVLNYDKYMEAVGKGELLGLKCNDCGAIMATPRQLCANCKGENLSTINLSGRGTIATYTIISVPPPKFERYAPYAIAQIHLEEGSGVTARLVDVDLEKVSIGQKVKKDCVDRGGGDIELVFRPA